MRSGEVIVDFETATIVSTCAFVASGIRFFKASIRNRRSDPESVVRAMLRLGRMRRKSDFKFQLEFEKQYERENSADSYRLNGVFIK